MLQPQIVDYAKSQLKLGVSRDAIKSALLAVGWPEADVEESLASAEVAPAQAGPAAQGGAEKKEAVQDFVKGSPSEGFGGRESEGVIKVSDLISSPNSKLEVAKPAVPAGRGGQAGEKIVLPDAGALTGTKPKEEKEKKEEAPIELGELGGALKKARRLPVAVIVLVILSVGLGAAAGWFYFKNMNLNAELASLKSEAGASGAKVAELESRARNLEADLEKLNKEKQELLLEFGFFVASPESATGTESQFSNLKGTLGGGGKTLYTITTARGLQLTIKNSKAADAALKPLLGQEITISGTYVPGSRELTIREVNGTPVEAPAASE